MDYVKLKEKYVLLWNFVMEELWKDIYKRMIFLGLKDISGQKKLLKDCFRGLLCGSENQIYPNHSYPSDRDSS